MEQYILSLFYIAILLVMGVIVTAITNKLRLSNVLFLVLAGFGLTVFGLEVFSHEFTLAIGALALILIVLETAMEVDLTHILKNFLQVLKFNLIFFVITTYLLTLFVYMTFDIPGNPFQTLILCVLLSIIIYGSDSSISMEFFKGKKNKINEMLKIEGVISGPIVVVFAFFLIGYLESATALDAQMITNSAFVASAEILFAVLFGIFMAYFFFQLMKHFNITKELSALLILSVAIFIFVITEYLGANGSLAVAVYGIFLRGLTRKAAHKKYFALLGHILFFIIFIIFGMQIEIPGILMWIKGLGLFALFILIRYGCTVLFLKKLNFKEKWYFTLNVAQGIEVIMVMLLMQFYFSELAGISLILSLAFMFFVYSYVSSTFAVHFSHKMLRKSKSTKTIKK